MKKIILLFIFSIFLGVICFSQGKKTYYKRTRKSYNENLDSSRYYYLRGWDAYKQNDLGAARYYWERGANCYSNIPSRYSCAFRLGLMNQNGEGIGVNYGNAMYYYKLAYNNGKSTGDNEATKIIAAYYENGIFVIQDFNKALDWYQKAKAQGNLYCNDDIARVKQKIAQY